MSRPERRYGRYVGLLALVILVLVTINTIMTKPNGAKGIEPGHAIPPFAAPLALGTLSGDVNVATRFHEGTAGRTPACSVRGPGVLNVCALYHGRPLVLALFVDASSCPDVLSQMQALTKAFPAVSFAAVAIKGERKPLLALMRKRGLTSVQVGFDRDGILTGLYKMASCPQVSFVLPGGVVQSPALLDTPSPRVLRARVGELAAAAGIPAVPPAAAVVAPPRVAAAAGAGTPPVVPATPATATSPGRAGGSGVR